MYIQKMSQHSAEMIANNWKYDKPFDFYNIESDKEDYQVFVHSTLRGEDYFEVWDENLLIGYFCLERLQSYRVIELELGLKPSEAGKGRGKDFVKKILTFLKQQYKTKVVVVAVASFNKRAIKVYRRSGFECTHKFMMETNGENYTFFNMNRKL